MSQTYNRAHVPGTAVVLAPATAAVVSAARPGRVQATFTNDDAANVAYIVLGSVAEGDTVAVNVGVRLNAAGGSYTTPVGYTGTVSGFSTAGARILAVEV